MTLVQRPSLKCTDTHGQEFRPNNIHYAFISCSYDISEFLRENHNIFKRFRVFTSNMKQNIFRITFPLAIIQPGGTH